MGCCRGGGQGWGDRTWLSVILSIGFSLGGLGATDERAAATDGEREGGAIAPNNHSPLMADDAGELLRNIVLTAESPLNPPTMGDFEVMLPHGDDTGELLRNIVLTAENPLNPPTMGDFEVMPPQNWGLGGHANLSELPISPTFKFANSIMAMGEAENGMWDIVNTHEKRDKFPQSADLLLAAPENLNPGLRLPPPPPEPLPQTSPGEPPSPSSSESAIPKAPWLVLENLQVDFRNETDNFDQLKRILEPTVQFRLPNDNRLSVGIGFNTFNQPGVEAITHIPLQIGWEGELDPFTLNIHAGVDIFDRLPAVPTFDAKAAVTILPNVTVSASVEQGSYQFNAQTLENQITAWRYGPDLFWQINPNTSLFSLLRFGQYNDGNQEQQSFTRLEHRLGQFSVAANLFNWRYQQDAELASGYFSPPDFLVYNGEIAWAGDVFDFLSCRVAGSFGNQRLQGAWSTAYAYQALCTAQLSPQIEADFGYAFSNVRSRTGGSAFNTEGLSGQLRVSF